MDRGRLQESILPLAVVTIVGMMVFPLPAAVLDVLLAANLAFSLLLLFTAVYTRDPEKFTVLPSLLLLTTLFRLGLNVSTTRQLLTYGEAPQVVAAFGEFVVGGNVLVGCVVFLIVTLVQFIVVSKGAERVAEVAARFTLDAMPGKQMAIDADIRAGILSLTEARERRRDLQRESKLFGALDGAMKFVKGDAIAGLCIAVLNIGAGFFIGVFQLGMSAADALDRYTIFTIGDSLVSQVPALLVSVAAGIAVTRVGESDGSTMASELTSQLTSEPKVLTGTAAMLAVLAFSPGLPAGIFLFLAAGGWLLAYQRTREAAVAKGRAEEQGFSPRAASPLLLSFSPAGRDLMIAEGSLPKCIAEARKEIHDSLGVLLPEPEWAVASERQGAWAGISLDSILLGDMNLSAPHERFAAASSAVGEVKSLFLRACKHRIEDFVDDTQTRTLLDLHTPIAEDLITAMVPKQVSVTTLSRLLRDLVGEGVGIGNLRGILQAIAEHCLVEGPIEYPLTEVRYLALLGGVRVHLRRQITATLPRTEGRIAAWELSPPIDRLLERAVQTGCPVSIELAETIVSGMRSLTAGSSHVILCSQSVRKLLFQLTRTTGRVFRIVTAEELSDEESIDILGQILVPSNGADNGGPVPLRDVMEDGEQRGRDVRLAA